MVNRNYLLKLKALFDVLKKNKGPKLINWEGEMLAGPD